MTKKNKLLSLICLAVLALVCACGMMYSGSTSAKAEVTMPTVDSSAIYGRNVTVNSNTACTGGSTGLHTIQSEKGAKGVDYIIIEWTNTDAGIPGAGDNTLFYGAGATANCHSKQVAVVNANALTAMRAANANVKMYFNVTNGAVSVVTTLDDVSTQFELDAFTPVTDSTATNTLVGICFHSVSAETKVVLEGLKIYTNTGVDLRTKLGDRLILTDETVPTTAVSSTATGADYVSAGGSKYISTTTATNSEWIIFEMTTVANENVMAALNNFYFGLGTASGSANATDTSVSDWSPITPLLNGGLVRYFLNTKTGSIYVSTSAIDVAPVLTALTAGGNKSYTVKNVGVSNVFGKIYFNANVTTIDLNGLKAYDENGNDLGIATNLTVDLDVNPNVDAIAGTDLKIAKEQGNIANANAPADGAKWIVFDWTNGPDGSNKINNPQNAFHMAVKNDGTFGSGAMPAMTGGAISQYDAHTRILVNIETGDAYYEVNGTPNKFKTFTMPALGEGQYYTVTMLLNGFAIGANVEEGTPAPFFYMNGLKIYDDLGTDLGVKQSGNWVYDIPSPDVSGITGKDLMSSGVAETYIANATGTTSRWIIMEWTNLTDALANGSGAGQVYIGTEANGKHSKGDPANLWFICNKTSAETAKLAFDTATGKIYRALNGGNYTLATTIGGIAFDGTAEVYANFCIHKANTAEIAGLKIYDENGNDLGVNTSFVQSLSVNPDVDAIEGENLRIAKEQGYIANANAPATGAKWIVFDWTNGPDGSNKINNPQNAFHMAVKNDGTFGTGAMPVMTGGAISKYDAHTRILVNIETGDAYYEVNGAPTLFKTFTMPALGDGQYYTVTMLLNGFANTGLFYMNGLKIYDDLGTDLGVKTSGNWLPNIPEVEAPDGEGVLGKSTSSCLYISNAEATVKEWVFIEWTNVTDIALGNGAGSSYCYVGPNAGLQHGTALGAGLWDIFNKKYINKTETPNPEGGEPIVNEELVDNITTVKLAFNTFDGRVYKFLNGGYPILAGTIAGIANDGTVANYVCFCLHKANTAEVTGLKVYDSEGEDLGVKTSFVDYPVVDGDEITETVDAVFTSNCGGNGYIYMDNAIANASGVSDGAKWIIFEWTNGANNNVGGLNGAFMGIQADPSRTAHAKNDVGGLFAANGVMKLYVNVETGVAIYATNGAFSDIGTLTLPELQEGQYAIVSFGPHTPAARPVVMTGIKCYDDLGNNLGVKVGGNGATIATEPTINAEVTGEDIVKESGKFVLNNEIATTSEWIVFEWTNGAENTAAGGHNALYLNILADASTALTVDKMAAEHLGRIFKTANANVKLYFNTREGYMGYAIDGITADGQIHVIATGLGTTDGSTAVYAKLDTINAVGGVFNGFKCYDGEGNDLGVKTNVLPAEPNPEITEVSSINLKISAPQGYIANVNAPAANAKWIIFDWTNGPDGSNRINNPQNAFHMGVKADGSYATGAQPVYTGGTISAYDTRVRIMIDLETGDAYYKLGDNKFVFFNTLALPGLEEGQYYTATILLNGFALGADEETGITPFFFMNNLKIYDDLGNDLGVKTSGNWAPDIPEVTAPEGEGDEFLSKVDCTYIASAIATKSEWVFIEWTNKTDIALDNGANSSYCYVGPNAGLQHGTSLGGGLWNIFNKKSIKITETENPEGGEPIVTEELVDNIATVKLVFNTFDGRVYKSVNGGSYISAGVITGIANDGTVANHVCFCIHNSTNDIEIEGLKIYDVEGNDLGATFTEYKEYNVKFEVTKVDLQPDITANVKDPAGNNVLDPETGDPVTETNSRWLIYFKVTDVDTNQEIMPNLLGFGGTGHSLNINGQDVTPTYSSSMYEYTGKYTWVLYCKTIGNGLNNSRALAPTVVKFAEGAELGAGNYKLIISEDLYLFFSGINVVASTTGEMTEVLLKENKVGSGQDTNKRYSIGSSFTDKEGNDIAGIGLYNFYANLNGKTGAQELVLSDYQQGSNLFNYSALTAGATTSAQVTARYYYLAKGTVIGGAYKLAEDLVLIVNGNDFRLIKAKTGGYAITYAGLGEGMSHTNPATYDYATDGFKTLAAPTVADANKKFLGWFDGNTQVTALTGITSDVTLTAKFAAASLWQAQATFKGDKFIMNFFLKSDIADLDLNAAIEGYTIAEGEDVTDDFDLEEGEYVYKFTLEVPASEINTEFSFDFVTAIGSIVLDKVENYSVAKYLDAVVALEDASDELKTLVADIKAYAYVLDADATNDNVEGMSEVATVEAGDAFARKGTNTPNYDLADPISVAYVDGKFEFTIKANVTEMNMATVDVVIGDTVINVANITGAADAEAKEYKFSVDVMQLGYMEISINVGGGAKSDVLMVNGAKFIALKSADITENKAILDRASCLVVSAQAYLAA